MLDHVLQFKEEPEGVNNKNFGYNLYIIAHNRSHFDSYVVLKNLPPWTTVVSLIKKGSGSVSLKIFECYVDNII